MDFDEYVAARYGRLIEHAVLLGCAEGEAGTYVDHVLLDQRKRIRKAEDPDPLVHEALERAIAGTPDRRSRTGPLVAVGLVAVAVAVGVALTYRPPPEPMPSLFALNGDQAEALLEDHGLEVVVRPARACEPQGLVLGSDPPAGRPVQDGATVTVRTAVPSGATCDAQYADRSDAWRFVGFALGGPPPEFARTVTVVVDSQDPYSIDHLAAVDPDRWGGLFKRVSRVARATAPTTSGMPRLTVRGNLLPTVLCGVPKPDGTGDRRVLRLEIDSRADGDVEGCPLTIDLYRSSDRAIDGVVVYTPKSGPVATVRAQAVRVPRWPGERPR
jgi:PASTA domain-containing protein